MLGIHPPIANGRRWVAIALVTVFAPIGSARAQPSEFDKDRAGLLMDHGDKLTAEARYQEALEAYRHADELVGVPTTRLAVAEALVKVGQLVEAREVALRVEQIPLRDSEPTPFRHARKEARSLVARLDIRIPQLIIMIDGLETGVEPRVTLDGHLVPQVAQPVRANPGSHQVQVSAPGHRTASATMTLAEGNRNRVRLVLQSTRAQRMTVRSPTVEPARPVPALAYVGFGIGAAGLAVGSVAGVWTFSKSKQLEEDCPGKVCPSSREGDLQSTRTMGWISTISFGVGIAGAGVGLVALLTQESAGLENTAKRTSSPRITPVVGISRIGLTGTF